MASATGSTPALPPDPLRLKRRLLLQGGGFALLLLLAFSGSLYWGIALQRGEDQRSELRQLAATAAAQLPLIAHETREAEGRAKFRSGPHRIAVPALAQQRVQWFDPGGRLLSEQGSLAVPAMPAVLPTSASGSLWQQWPGGIGLVQMVQMHAVSAGADATRSRPERAAQRPRLPAGRPVAQALPVAVATAASGSDATAASGSDATAASGSQTTETNQPAATAASGSDATAAASGSQTTETNQPAAAAASGSAPQRLGFVRVALSDRSAMADLDRLRRGLLLGGIVTALAALLVGRRMLRIAFQPLQQQVSALQRFTADASHELRHPLTALSTLLAAVPAELRKHPALAWPELDRLSRRMAELLEDLLSLARLQQSGDGSEWRTRDWQHFDLLELLEDLIRCYAPQAAARAITLQLSPAPEQHRVPVEGDSEELLRLFTNLLLNAIRHSPEATGVSLEVSMAGRRVQVAVSDQGPGIPLAQREQVFDRFWSGADRGGHSGLGLAIGRAIARRHGGELRLGESRPGRCVLLVELPAATDPPQTS